MRKDESDLHRHRIGRVRKIGRMKILKCPLPLHRLSQHSPITFPLAPRLVKPIATRTREGRGVPSASNSGGGECGGSGNLPG